METRGLIEVLEHFRIRLLNSYHTHAFYMKYNSEYKEKCPYYIKSMKLFEKFDLEELRELINELNTLANEYKPVFLDGNTVEEEE